MTKLGPARGPKRAHTGRAWKSRPAAFTGRNGPNDSFLFKIPLFIVRWALGSNNGIRNCYNF